MAQVAGGAGSRGGRPGLPALPGLPADALLGGRLGGLGRLLSGLCDDESRRSVPQQVKSSQVLDLTCPSAPPRSGRLGRTDPASRAPLCPVPSTLPSSRGARAPPLYPAPSRVRVGRALLPCNLHPPEFERARARAFGSLRPPYRRLRQHHASAAGALDRLAGARCERVGLDGQPLGGIRLGAAHDLFERVPAAEEVPVASCAGPPACARMGVGRARTGGRGAWCERLAGRDPAKYFSPLDSSREDRCAGARAAGRARAGVALSSASL